MVPNLQEMGLDVMGHKSDIPSLGTRWPRPGNGGGGGIWCAVDLHAGHHIPQLGSTLADLHTNAHCHLSR